MLELSLNILIYVMIEEYSGLCSTLESQKWFALFKTRATKYLK